jgi:arginine utilization regulatory protein
VEEALVSYSWPGNIRELKNYIEGAMNIVSSGHVIGREHFSLPIQAALFKDAAPKNIPVNIDIEGGLDEVMSSMEKKIITEAMDKSGGNISKCARLLKIKRQTLQHKMKKYNIQTAK